MTSEARTRRSVRNRKVQFQINDVYFPEREKILEELHGNDVLRGKVIDVSEGGEHGETFVVVQVDGLSQTVVVPLRSVRKSV